MTTQMPSPRHAPLVDPRTGMLAPTWVRPFEELFSAPAAAGAVTNVTNVTNTTTVVQADEQAPAGGAIELLVEIRDLLQAIFQQPAPDIAMLSRLARDVDGLLQQPATTQASGEFPSTVTFPGGVDFSLNTASIASDTTQRGNITFKSGDNDTFTGCEIALEGATPSGNGGITATVGGAISTTSESVSVTAGDWTFYLSSDAGIESSGSGDLYLTAGGGITIAAPSGVAFFGDSFQMLTPGSGIDIAEGADARMGVSTLVGGTATVNTSAVQTNSRIQLTGQQLGTITVPVARDVTSRVDGVSFTITSADPTDTSDVAWIIFNPV